MASVVLGLGLLLHPMAAHAVGSSISLTTSPVVLNLTIRPGSSDTRTLQLMNNSAEALKIDMHVAVFSAKGDNGDATITEPLPSDQSVNWLSFSPSSFVAKPGVWSSVKMTINLPTSASLGYYYAVLFKPELPDQPTANTTRIKGTNGILVLVDTQSGNESRQIDLAGFVTTQGLYEYLPATFKVTVRNQGNIYLAPTGNIFVSRSSDFSNNQAVLDINPNDGNVLPHSSRDFQVQWSDGFPFLDDKKINGQTVYDDHGQPIKQLSWNFARFSKIRIGQYFAKVTLVYSDGKRVVPLTKVVSFWVIPWRLMLIGLAVVFVLVIGLVSIGRFMLKAFGRTKVYRL